MHDDDTIPHHIPDRIPDRIPDDHHDHGAALRAISGTRLRRAVLGVLLLAAPEPRSVGAILSALADVGVVPSARPPRTARHALAEILRYQRRLGRVRRLDRGVYVVDPASMHPSMRSRARTTLRRLGEPADQWSA